MAIRITDPDTDPDTTLVRRVLAEVCTVPVRLVFRVHILSQSDNRIRRNDILTHDENVRSL